MNDTNGAREEQLDRIFHALANRSRRSMLKQLAGGPARVTELAEPLAMSLPSVSKNLKVLERAGLIERTVQGRVHSCDLGTAALADAVEWLAFYRRFWAGTLEAVADYVEREPGNG